MGLNFRRGDFNSWWEGPQGGNAVRPYPLVEDLVQPVLQVTGICFSGGPRRGIRSRPAAALARFPAPLLAVEW